MTRMSIDSDDIIGASYALCWIVLTAVQLGGTALKGWSPLWYLLPHVPVAYLIISKTIGVN